MIIKIFKNVGKGSSRGPINYLLGKDKDGNIREPAPIELNKLLSTEGSKDAVAFLIDNNHRQNKYTSGVIAFRDDEKPTAKQIQDLIKDFRKTFLPGLDENKIPILWVMHKEKSNIELHFLVPKQEASTSKAFNIAPPGQQSQKLFIDFQKIQNDKMCFKQVTANLLKAQFDTFEKNTRKAKISEHLTNKVKKNELHTYSDLLRHLEHDLKIKVTRRGKDFISVKMPGKDKAVRLQGPAFTPGADLRELLKQSSNQPTKLNPDEILKTQISLNSGIKARELYNKNTYLKPISYKNRSLNLKSQLTKTPKTSIKDVLRVAVSNSTKPFEEVPPVPVQPLKTAVGELSTSTHTNPSTSDKNSQSARSGGSGGGGSGGGLSSIDSQIAAVKAKMNNEKDPGKRAALHAQLMALQVKKELQARQQHNDELKRINKIKP